MTGILPVVELSLLPQDESLCILGGSHAGFAHRAQLRAAPQLPAGILPRERGEES